MSRPPSPVTSAAAGHDLHRPGAAGLPPGQRDPGCELTGETPAGEVTVRAARRLDPPAGGRLRVTCAAETDRPAGIAEEAGAEGHRRLPADGQLADPGRPPAGGR
jgi:hypothetical protein